MEATGPTQTATGGDDARLFRLSGIAGIFVALAYPVIIVLFVLAGTDQPVGEGGAAWLSYLSGNTGVWWAIVGLSVLTDVLWIPVAWAVYVALRAVDRTVALVGSGLLVLFVILEMATSWPSYAVLIALSGDLQTATVAQRTDILAAAGFAAAIISSHLLSFYAILLPALGQLFIGAVMRRGGPFGRTTAYFAVAAGFLGVLAVFGGLAWEPLGQAIILGSLLSGVWFFLVGYRLWRMSAASTP